MSQHLAQVGLKYDSPGKALHLAGPGPSTCVACSMDHAENTTADTVQAAQQLVYPLPDATQEQVSLDREVFDRALKRIHAYFSITDKPPRVGGRELDLFQLYRNVTALGGCAEVIANKQWRVRNLRNIFWALEIFVLLLQKQFCRSGVSAKIHLLCFLLETR